VASSGRPAVTDEISEDWDVNQKMSAIIVGALVAVPLVLLVGNVLGVLGSDNGRKQQS
jgi:hypothetical protein